MITVILANSPGYPTRNPDYLGFISHGPDNTVGVGVNSDYKSTLPIRRYLAGLEKPNYPMPAIRCETVVLVNWHGEHRMIVIWPNQSKDWRGYKTIVHDYF